MNSTKTLIAFGYHHPDAPRYRNVRKAFEKEGYEIIECRTETAGFLAKCRDLKAKFKQLAARSYQLEAVIVTFPGHYIVPLAWLLTRNPRRKLIFDAFISLSDTLVSDRKKFSWVNPVSWVLYLVDLLSCHLADQILLDTEAHKRFFSKRFFLNPARIRVIYVGTRDDLFTRSGPKAVLPEGKWNVLFIGTYIPLQGVEYILEAAKILESESDVHFTLIGGGQTKEDMLQRAGELRLRNVTFLDFQPIDALPSFLRGADVALGIFGTSKKATRVIPHKVFDAVACGVPVITAHNDAIQEIFVDGKEVFLCEAGNGASLAEKILELKKES